MPNKELQTQCMQKYCDEFEAIQKNDPSLFLRVLLSKCDGYDRGMGLETRMNFSNDVAERLLGWHIDSDDERRLWRIPSGAIVRVKIKGVETNLCQHPYRQDTNADDDLSFDPGFNYHRNSINWQLFVKRALYLIEHDLLTYQDGIAVVQHMVNYSDVMHDSRFNAAKVRSDSSLQDQTAPFVVKAKRQSALLWNVAGYFSRLR